jgi:ABC-2 type transport system ATP-binding protein
MIELKNVCKSYNKGAVRAVDGLTLDVPPGEIFGFLGPNGAGKTTTIKMIVGILAPDAGTIAIEGRDNRRAPLACKAVTAYVPDAPEIYERLTGIEYLNFIGDVYGVPARERGERAARRPSSGRRPPPTPSRPTRTACARRSCSPAPWSSSRGCSSSTSP